MENMTSTQLAQLLYVAYYGRPADASGLTFWAEQIDAVGVEGVAADFGASAEFEARFGDLTNEELVQNLYQQLFGRDGEQAGVDYWVNLLENGTPLAQIALEIANGAQNADITAINNKVAVAQRFTEAAGDDYAGDDAANIARDFLLTVDADTDAETADVEGALDSVADLTTFTLAEAQAAEALPAKYTIEDSAANLVAAASAAAITTLANAEAIVVAGDATVEQMNALINVSEYSNIESYTLNDTVENLLAGGDIVANAASATVAGEPVLTVAQYNEIAAVATVETYTVVDTAEAILEAGADAAALANAGSVAITDEAVTLEQAVALDALSLDVAYPAVDVSLEAAAAADTLPANYALTADVFAAGEVTVEAATAAFGAVSAIVAGAANAEELAVADLFTWSVADTLENIEAADAAVIEGADAYTLTNEAGDLGELTGEQYELVLGAANADAYTYTVVPSPITGISAQGPVVEGNDIAFTVEMDYAVNVERVISYQIEGATTGTAGAADALADLGQITGTVTIPAGETTGTITLTPLEDGTTEGREAFTVSLLNDDGTEVVATSNVVVIEDNANAGQNVALTTTVDEFTGGAGNDTFTALIDGDNTTLNNLDSIDGAGGDDTLRLNIQDNEAGNGGAQGDLTDAQVSNVENAIIRSGVSLTADTTDWAGLENATVSRVTGDLNLTVADTVAADVSGVTGTSSVTGGESVVVTQDTNAVVGNDDISSDTVNSITVTDAADVTITANNSEQNVVTANIGGGNLQDVDGGISVVNATGEVNVSATGAATDGENAALDDITVTGGTTVNVTQTASADMSEAETDATAATHTLGDVNVTGGDNTTTVNVIQDDQATATNAVAAKEGVAEQQTVKFVALKDGESVTIDGLTFTASDDLSAAQVAEAFAGLTSGGDLQDAGGPTANGIYTGELDGNWVSGDANGDSVVFSQAVAGTGTFDNHILNGATAGNATVTKTQNAVTAAAGVTGALGVTNGAVAIDDNANASITDIVVDGYGAGATLGGGGGSLNALENLTLRNSGAGTADVTTTQTALNLTVDDVDATVTVSNSITDLILNAENVGSSFALNTTGVENVTINANAELTLSGTALAGGSTSVQSVTVNGSEAVVLGDISTNIALNSFDASGNNGGVTATIETDADTLTGDIEEYVFSGGDDDVTVSANAGTAVDVKVSTGAGDDKVTLASGISAAGSVISGGEGTDTLGMAAADAETASATTTFETTIDGFEKLSLGNVTAGQVDTVDLANMDDINYVIAAASTIGKDVTVTGSTDNAADTVSLVVNGVTYTTAAAAYADGTAIAAALATAIDGNNGLSASAAAGVLTVTSTTTHVSVGEISATSGGGAADTVSATTAYAAGEGLVLNNLGADATVELTNESQVTANLTDASGSSDSINVVVNNIGGTGSTTADFVVADVETVNILVQDGDNNGPDTHDLTLAADSVTSVTVGTQDGTAVDSDGNMDETALTLNITEATAVATVDASNMVGAFTYIADDGATTVTGGMGNDNLTADGNGDVLNGGAGNDTLTGDNLSQLTGGEGADTFVMNTPSNANTYSTILDLEAGDVIDFDVTVGQTKDVKFSSSAVELAGTGVFQDYANEAVNLLGADGDDAAWFQFDGNTYIVQSGNTIAGNDFVNGEDSIIQITGLVDLSTASYNQTNGTLEIA